MNWFWNHKWLPDALILLLFGVLTFLLYHIFSVITHH